MSDFEERLRAALRARGDQVQPDDLRAGALPERSTAGGWWRRPEVYLAVAAVLIVALAVPFLAMLSDGDSNPPEPAGSPVPSSGSTGPDQRMQADVDGDGEMDEIRSMAGDSAGATYLIEISFASGITRAWYAGSGPVDLRDAIDLDEDVGGAEVLVEVGEDPVTLVVLGEGAGDRLDVMYDRRVRRGSGENGYRFDWWIVDGAIRSTLSLRSVPDDATAYAVRVVDWVFDNGGVDRRSIGEFCVAAAAPKQLAGCDEITPDPGLR